LSLSRALRSLHRDIILLEGPCDQLSEAQERSFFQLLRSEMGSLGAPDGLEGKGKVVIITASRFATALHADRVIVMLDGRVGQEGTYKELISQPGPFRDQLFPPAL
jgi:ABC-type transport system involved in cytochrome bd biosynthesis fused ATPase/permease subunit